MGILRNRVRTNYISIISSKEELQFLEENVSNIITSILNSIDEKFDKDLYLDFKQVFEQITTLKLNSKLRCPNCKDLINNNQECKKCNIIFVDLVTNIPFLKSIFQCLLIQDYKLCLDLIEITLEGLKLVIHNEFIKNNISIDILIKEIQDKPIPQLYKIKINSIEKLKQVIEKIEEIKKMIEKRR